MIDRVSSLQGGVPETTIGDANNVPVSSDKDVTELLRERNSGTSSVVDLNVRAVRVQSIRGVNTGGGHVVRDANVSELTVVSRTSRAKRVPRLQGIRPGVVASLIRDGVHQKIRVNQREVVRALSQTSGVLVDQRGEGNRVRGGLSVSVNTSGRQSSVVTPLATTRARGQVVQRRVLSSEAEENNRVRQTNVEGGRGRDILEGSGLSALDLVNQNIARGVTHLNTLVVVNNSVVSERLRVNHARGRGSRSTALVDNNIVDSGVREFTERTVGNDDQLLPSAEGVVDLNVVERQSRNRQSNTRVLAEPERKRDREVATRTERSTSNNRVNHAADVTDHVLVANALGTRLAELVVHVKPETVELLHSQLVKGNGNLVEDVVHKVASPSQRSGVVNISNETNLGDTTAEPNAHDVVTRSVDRSTHITLTEVNRASVAKRNRDVREPVTLLNSGDEPRNRVGTTVQVTLELGESCEVNKDITCVSRASRHFILKYGFIKFF